MRLVSATILAALVLISSSPAGAQSGSPELLESIEPAADTASVETIGPDGLGSVPSPPIGPAWQVGLERSLHNVLEMDAVACQDGFTLLAYGSDRRYRPRALVFTSPDGVEWSRGGPLRPRGDPIAGAWAVHELVEFRGDLLALGGEDRRLVVWRSRDCGQSWRRLRDRPVFYLDRKAIELNAVEAVATDDTLLVLGRQSGELNPRRDWAWTLDDEEGWRRVRGLGDAFDFGLTSDGQRFLASRLAEDATAGTSLVTSLDGRRWHDDGHLPDRTTVIPDAARERLLAQSKLVGTGWLSPEIQASADAMDWSLLARAAPVPHGSSGRLYESDGVLVWIIDIWDDTDTNTWGWIGVSEDGGATWTVSAGQPGMQLAGLQSVAATDDALVLAFTGEGFDEINAWTLPREQADESAAPAPSTSEPTTGGSTGGLLPPGVSGQTDALDGWGPLAVIEGGGGPDARSGHGTLSIGADCVTFTTDRTDEAVTLVWGSDRTSWRPEKRLIVHTHEAQGTTRLSDGDRVWFGGMAIAEGGESMQAWLEGVWVQRPDPSCPTGQWLVGDVNLLE